MPTPGLTSEMTGPFVAAHICSLPDGLPRDIGGACGKRERDLLGR